MSFIPVQHTKFKKKIIFTEQAPKPIGPYSQAVLTNEFLFVSGQIGIDPTTNELVKGGVESEFIQVMKNIHSILHSAGLNFSDIVKTSIFLTNLKDFQLINKIYSNYFEENYPARETIEVCKLPKNANVEVSVIAIARKKRK